MESNGGDSGAVAEEGERESRALARERRHLRNHKEAEDRKDFSVPLKGVMSGSGDLGNNEITLGTILCTQCFFF